MVELKGSEKQIIWAEEIRKDIISGVEIVEQFEDAFKGKEEKNKKSFEVLKDVKEFKEALMKKDESSYFIYYKEVIGKRNGEKCLNYIWLGDMMNRVLGEREDINRSIMLPKMVSRLSKKGYKVEF